AGSTVLIVGFGRIGRRVGELLEAFGADVLIFDPYLSADAGLPRRARRVEELHEGLAAADFVTLHAAGADEIIAAPELAAIKDGAILLNSARGELVNEAALVEALRSGKVGAVWFDAFWQEPYTGPLTEFGQALLTPHAGTYTVQ